MDLAIVFLTIGALFLFGLAADWIGRRSALPRVTLLLLGGLAVGEAGLGLMPEAAFEWYEFLSVTALTMVAFLLGGSLTLGTLRTHGRAILLVSLSVVIITSVMVAGGLWLAGVELKVALVLGAIATATAPAATLDVLRQTGVRNGFTDTLEGIVAIDDVWGLIVFSLVLVVARETDGFGALVVLEHAGRDIAGAVALGLAVGLPAAYLTGRVTPGEPLQAEALGIVFVTAGAALWLDVSFLLAGMTAGGVIVNLGRHHERGFHEIEHVQWPFMLMFFILAGSSLEPEVLATAGWLGAGYVVLRALSRMLGGWVGALLGQVPVRERRWYGVALLPQAGVAVGMALVAADAFPEQGATILTVTIASTVVFEIVGPLGTRVAVSRVAARES